ncbi:MAG: 50S ribosomal protein L25 [Planctomycetes bacterium]|nr:50S ribosomal protein L25 [Planctomycetota bacterium]
MSATLTFPGSTRTETGTIAANKLRAAGKVPVTISRRGQASQLAVVDVKTAAELASKVVHLCRLTIDGKTITVLRGEIVRHTLKDHITHIDLVEVDEKSTIKVDVAVIPDARNCPGVKAGGIVEQRLRRIKVSCPAHAIPDQFEINLDAVELSTSVLVEAVKLPKGVTLVTPPKSTLLSVVIPRGMKKGEEEAATEAANAAASTPAAEGDKKAGAAAPAAAAGDKAAADKAAPAKKK